MKPARSARALIPRKQVRIKSHIGGAARIRIIAQGNQLRTLHSRSELHNRSNNLSADLRSKYDYQVLLAPHFLTERRPGIAVRTLADQCVECTVIPNEVRSQPALSTRRKTHKARCLPAQLDLLRVRHIQP